ncbi:MAG: sigma-70 family RNA polymerase sigma factor [Planctomycetes bacterium]|nr:sigma-70 family RNA polymerase sigma factor [Planctomycetota bacterium]
MAASDPEFDEGELIRSAQAGDAEARDALCRRHLSGVMAWVRLKRSDLIAERESIMDVVQTVFRQALGDLKRFEYRGGNSFRNWLLTYADNKLRNREQFHRAARRRPEREVAAPLSQLYASIATPSQVLSEKENIERFEFAFGRLSESDRQIILLARIEGRSHDEIAERLGISAAASRKALSRAIVRLAMHLGSPD